MIKYPLCNKYKRIFFTVYKIKRYFDYFISADISKDSKQDKNIDKLEKYVLII
jgi:hypothetical protein